MKRLKVSIKPFSLTVGVMFSEKNLSSINTDNVKLTRKLIGRKAKGHRKKE